MRWSCASSRKQSPRIVAARWAPAISPSCSTMSSRITSRRSSKTRPLSPDSIHTHVAAARERLRQAGIVPDEAELDARLLAEHLLGWDTARYFASGDEPEPPGFAPQFEALVARRVEREPLAYILGRQEFWGLTFHVSPAVLIPR